MTSRQSDPSQLSYDIYSGTPDKKAESSVKLLSDQDFQDELSPNQERMVASYRQSPLISAHPQRSGNPSKGSLWNRQLDPYFVKVYQAIMAMIIVVTAMNFTALITKRAEFNTYALLISGFAWVQAMMAIYGVQTRNLQKIEKALTLIKVFVVFFSMYMFDKVYTEREGTDELEFSTESFLRFVLAVGMYFVLLLSTKRVRDILKADQEVQESDPIETLETWPFRLFKYLTAALFCSIGYDLIYFLVLIEFFNFKWIFEITEAHPSILLKFVKLIVLSPLTMLSLFLFFQGMRKKSLSNILMVIPPMKILLPLEIILDVVCYLMEDSEKKAGLDEFVFMGLVFKFAFQLVSIKVARKVGGIFKEHQKVKQI